MTDPNLLRRAIESVGIEKPSDYTLVLEEVERLMDERLVEKVARAIFRTDWPKDDWDRFGPKDNATERYRAMARTSIAEFSPLIRAASDLVQEMEEMGYGKTSDRALPGSWDTMVAALNEVKK